MQIEDQATVREPASERQRRVKVDKNGRANGKTPFYVASERLEQHRAWIDAFPQHYGKRLVLDGDYSGSSLQGADLRKSVIGANLRGANLRDIKLNGADLTGANLSEADLTCADLTDVKGLSEDNLAGADLTGATMPPELMKFENLSAVEEMSKSSGKYFVGLMAACSFALLTLASTSDVGLFTDTSPVTLPILHVAVSAIAFYWVTPALLLASFVYFHIGLQRLWDTLARLPAVFPDGKPLNLKVYPWLPNGLVAAYSKYLRSRPIPLMRLQKPISIFCAWWITPITLLFFWGRYLRRHDWVGTVYQIILTVLAGLSSLLFYRLMKYTLQHKENPAAMLRPSKWRSAWVYLVVVTALLGVTSDGDIRGFTVQPLSISDFTGIQQHRKWVPRLLTLVGYRPFADLSNADVSIRPANWSGQEQGGTPVDFSTVKGAGLQNRDLRNANLDNTFLARADFSGAQLNGCTFSHADLRQAQLSLANLTGANLRGADLRGAELNVRNLASVALQGADLRQLDLRRADLRGINLERVNLEDADLSEQDLTGSDLAGANLQRAKLSRAVIRAAQLRDANLSGADLAGSDLRDGHLDAVNLQGANLNGSLLIQCQLTAAHLHGAVLILADLNMADLNVADLSSAKLNGANLIRADLRAANLNDADLSGTDLQDADLGGADLRRARNLTEKQLVAAYTDKETRVSPPLILHIRRNPLPR